MEAGSYHREPRDRCAMAQIEALRYVTAHAAAIQLKFPTAPARFVSPILHREQTVDVFVTGQAKSQLLEFRIFRLFSCSVTWTTPYIIEKNGRGEWI